MFDLWKRFARSRSGLLGAALLSAVAIVAIFAPLIFRQSPFEMVGQPFQPPFGKYLFGTDSLGRDIAAGLAYGARTSLLIGVLATSVSVAVGILVGGLAGYYGGWLDDVLMRTTEFFQTIPYFILTIILVAILTPSVLTIILAIAVVCVAAGRPLGARRRDGDAQP